MNFGSGTKLKVKPTTFTSPTSSFQDGLIAIPKIDNVKALDSEWDQIPDVLSYEEITMKIRDCQYVLDDIEIQKTQRETTIQWKAIEIQLSDGDEDELLDLQQSYLTWFRGALNIQRINVAKIYVFRNALARAGYALDEIA